MSAGLCGVGVTLATRNQVFVCEVVCEVLCVGVCEVVSPERPRGSLLKLWLVRQLQVQNQHPCTFFPDSACCRSRCVCVETPVLVLQCHRLPSSLPPALLWVRHVRLPVCLSVCMSGVHPYYPCCERSWCVGLLAEGCRESQQCCENRQSVLPAELVALSVHWAAGALATQPAAVRLIVVGLGGWGGRVFGFVDAAALQHHACGAQLLALQLGVHRPINM